MAEVYPLVASDQLLHEPMQAEHDLAPAGIIAPCDVVGVAAGHLDRAVAQLLEPFTGDVSRLGDPQLPRVEVHARRLHRRCPGQYRRLRLCQAKAVSSLFNLFQPLDAAV